MKKRKENKEKQKGEEGESCVEERRKKERKKERHFLLRSSVNRRSKRIGSRDKVGPRDESYAWVAEIAGFVAFQNIGVFSYICFLFT